MSTVFQAGRNFAKAIAPANVYGVIWDGSSSTALTRTDDAANFSNPVPYVAGASSYGSPFDNLMPWSGVVRTVSLDNNQYFNDFVEIPKFWYKLTMDGLSLKVQIADGPQEGFSVSPAHMNRGDGVGERDVVYIGRYHSSPMANHCVSEPNVEPLRSISNPATLRASIQNDLGATVWPTDFLIRFTIWLLYIVEFADWNSQSKIGNGLIDTSQYSGAICETGFSDSMPYHTGTMKSSRSAYGVGVQYRWMEDLWGNCFDWLDGCFGYNDCFNIIPNPANWTSGTVAYNVGSPITGFPSQLSLNTSLFPLFYPVAGSGSSSSYIPDVQYIYNTFIFAGGDWYSSSSWDPGLFSLTAVSNPGSIADNNFGCRLMKLPSGNIGNITTLLTFTINIGEENTILAYYHCYPGMTWTEFVNSSYNVYGFSIYNNAAIMLGSYLFLTTTDGQDTIMPSNTIMSNYIYRLVAD